MAVQKHSWQDGPGPQASLPADLCMWNHSGGLTPLPWRAVRMPSGMSMPQPVAISQPWACRAWWRGVHARLTRTERVVAALQPSRRAWLPFAAASSGGGGVTQGRGLTFFMRVM